MVSSIVQSGNNGAGVMKRRLTTTTVGKRRAFPPCSIPRPLSHVFALHQTQHRHQLHQQAKQLHQAAFSTVSNDNNSSNSQNKTNNNNKSEDDDVGKFAMPDMDAELKLAKIQTSISQYYQQGDYVKALQLSTELFQQTQKHFGGIGSGRPQQDHPAVASALNNIGLMHKHLGDFIESRRHYNAALRIYAKVVGRDHASYAMTLHNLASLNKAQVHFDTSLKATDRLSLVETALEYFEEALAIRRAELGPDHPLTIATQSSLGTTLADQVLHQHRQVEMTKNGQSQQQPKKYMASLHPESVTRQGWDAAEYHLRQALQMAIDKPRGKSIGQGKNNNKKSNVKKAKKKTSTHASPPLVTAAASPRNEEKSSTSSVDEGVSGSGMHTLSAASAAQNLAIFLKSRAMTHDPYNMEQMEEARLIYQQVLNVRSQLLPNPHQHPDVVATKFSLAELLHVLGDEEAANAIRQEILDDYDPMEEKQEEEPASPSSSSLHETKAFKKKVMVEKTKAVTNQAIPKAV